MSFILNYNTTFVYKMFYYFLSLQNFYLFDIFNGNQYIFFILYSDAEYFSENYNL